MHYHDAECMHGPGLHRIGAALRLRRSMWQSMHGAQQRGSLNWRSGVYAHTVQLPHTTMRIVATLLALVLLGGCSVQDYRDAADKADLVGEFLDRLAEQEDQDSDGETDDAESDETDSD